MSDIQIHRIFIDATPEQVWEAITSPQLSKLYGYAGEVDYDLSPGGDFEHHAGGDMLAVGMPEVVVTGEVLEAIALSSASDAAPYRARLLGWGRISTRRREHGKPWKSPDQAFQEYLS